MKQFKPSALSIALLLGGVQVSALPLLAHAADAEENTATADESTEVIEVRGFRRSLIESINTKRFSDTVVEAVSADDIGGLPDVSIADALSRLPGVTSVRQGGQSSELNIRGLSGDFVFATLNGREIVTDQGGRSVQFDQYPAELISSAQVYKSQKASLVEGGVAGSINLDTINPLNSEKDHSVNFQGRLSFNDSAEDHPDANAFGNRFSISYQGKFLDETLGVGLGYARLVQPKISTQFVNYNPDFERVPYDGVAGECRPDEIDETVEHCDYLYVPTGFELMARGGEEVRNGYLGTVTWLPSDNLKLKADAFYSKFDSESYDRGFRVNGLNAMLNGNIAFENPVIVNNAIVGGSYYRDQSGTAINAPYEGSRTPLTIQTQSDDATLDSEILSLGFNAEWTQDSYVVKFDASHSSGESLLKDEVVRLVVFDDANADLPIATDDFVINYELNGLELPSISLNPNMAKALSDPNRSMVGNLEKYPTYESNEANNVKVDVKFDIDNEYISAIETGVRWAERSYDKYKNVYRYGQQDEKLQRNGRYVAEWDLTDPENPVPVEMYKPYKLSDGEYEVVNLGGEFSRYPSFLAIDNAYIEKTWLQGEDTTAIFDWRHSWTLVQESNSVQEETFAAYVQANINAEFMDMPVTGNFGVRVVRSEQKANGLQLAASEEDAVCIRDGRFDENDPTTMPEIACTFAQVTQGDTYTDVLPSLNLNFQVAENDQIRFAAAKVLARPDMNEMAVSGSWTYKKINDEFDANGDELHQADLTSTSSPLLQPFYANQIDVSYEHYFTETEGAFVAAVFYKDIESIVQEFTAENYDFVAAGIDMPETYIDPDGDLQNLVPGDYKAKFNNGQGGYIRGLEFAYTQTFSFLPGALSGLGFSGNFSYTQSELENSLSIGGVERTTPLPGLSKRVWTGALFYDYEDTFSTRINARYRDSYLGDQIAVGNSQTAFFKEELILDYQASYQITDEVQGVLSINNLTDEPNVSYFGEQYNTGTIQYFGRQFYFGVNVKM
ncbi:TonB-dependent receptor [Algibacillus agarilyticus]|uniref:TonB-dependent receptor n=1 Tax=Algibacillus agarilyticus TaxID=2234133 RepID=UPI000DD00F28|nr:TonB-dependent receptor [Algibacillus agarilyticus]